MRTRPAGSTEEQVATLHTPAPTLMPFGAIAINAPPEYAPKDEWGVTADGDVWIARGADFRVDWVSRDGRLASGRAREFEAIRTERQDLERWRGMPAPTYMRGVDRPMADLKAPFQAAMGTGQGEVWFWLNQRSGYTSERFECRPRDGSAGITLVLPISSKVIHSGARRMYVYSLSSEGDATLSAHAAVPCQP